jgi:hypothetical protein
MMVRMVAMIPTALCLVVVTTAGILHPIAGYQLRRYVRLAYPRIWRRFGFASVSPLVAPEHDQQEVIAAVGFNEFFSTGQFRKLNDPRLETLWRRKRVFAWLAAVALTLLMVSFLISH